MDTSSFKTFLAEKYDNVFSVEQKEKYADQVWEILVQSYKPIGGLKKIKNKEDMIKDFPMWKVARRKDSVLAVIIYKDKGDGRKLVAVGTDGTKEAKDMLHNMMEQEFTRSFFEVSGPLLKFLNKHFPQLVKQYTISPERAEEIIGKPVSPTEGGMYKRVIGGDIMEKMMLGTPGKRITR